MLNPLRYAAALAIATGGSMHLIGLIKSIFDGQVFSWVFYAVFLFAIPGYFLSAYLIFKNVIWGYIITATAPLVGGALIFYGFITPESQFLFFIPGTYTNEITLIGFITLISEPVAATFSIFLLTNKIWRYRKQDSQA